MCCELEIWTQKKNNKPCAYLKWGYVFNISSIDWYSIKIIFPEFGYKRTDENRKNIYIYISVVFLTLISDSL